MDVGKLTLTEAVDLAIDAIVHQAAKHRMLNLCAASNGAIRSSIALLEIKNLGTTLPGFESSYVPAAIFNTKPVR